MKLNAAVVIRASVAIVLLMLAGLLAWPGENAGAGGLDIVVNTPHDLTTDVCDETHCSLREAIMLANSNPEPDTITFDPEVFPPDDETDLVPFSSLPKIDASAGITIDGTGASVTIVGYEVNDSADAALYIRSNPGVDARDVVIKNIKMAYWPHRAILICAGEVPPVPPQDDPVCGYNLENVLLENISTPDEQVNLETGIVVEGANLSGIDFENVSVGPAYFEGIIILGANDVSDVTVRSGVIDVGDFAVIVEAGNVLTNARVEDVTAMGDRAIIVDSQTANNVVVEGNTAEGGIFFAGMGANNVIRENEAFAAFDRDGILVGSGRVTISRNSIHGNDKLGINLFSMSDPANGVTPNDGGDVDSGPNGLLNFPVLTGSTSQLVSGTACGECLVELFVSDNDASGYGEGMTFLRDGNADASGDFAVSICGLGLAAGTKVTATATDSGGNTSEFSLNYTLTESSGGCPATPSPSPTPTPTPTPIPTPTPTGQTPTPTPTGQAATPTPTPTSTPAPSDLTQGDNDCDGDSDAVDALKTLQDIAAIDYSQEPGCPEIGGAVPAGGEAQRFGDIDCDGDVDAVDALQILRNVAGLPLNQGEGCPAIGDEL